MSAKFKKSDGMIDKKEFLLQSIIQAYIEHLEPIGSTQLKSMYDITFSPATIRSYFKKLGDEGYLAQEHISSGRTPTSEALKEYWIKRLNFSIDEINLEALKYYAQRVGLSVFIKKQIADNLVDIINVDDKYILLEFSSFAVNVKFSDVLYRFLKDMIGVSSSDILRISKDVGAYEIYNSIKQSIESSNFDIFNYKEFLKLALSFNFDEITINRFLQGEILDLVKEGLYFEDMLPNDYIGICHKCQMDNEDVKILIIGELSKNYEYFYNNIKKF